MSDLNSLQNFSYYGRRFQDRQTRPQDESPAASDAVSLNHAKYVATASAFNAGGGPPQAQRKITKQGSGIGNTSADTMSENVSSLTGFYKGAGGAATAASGAGNGAEY